MESPSTCLGFMQALRTCSVRMYLACSVQGVTFIVMNAVELPADSKAGEESKQDASDTAKEAKMRTWAYRVKMASKLEEFTAAVNEHRAPVSAAEDNV